MSHRLLQDVCAEQARVLSRLIGVPYPAPLPPDWADDARSALAAHVTLLEQLADAGTPVSGMVFRVADLRTRAKLATSSQAVEPDDLDRRIGALVTRVMAAGAASPPAAAVNPAEFEDIDDAFARIAGVTREQWAAMVAAHPRRPVAAG